MKSVTLFWVGVIVAAELAAFDLLQKSIDSPARKNVYIASAILLMGVVVSLAFRETLRVGSMIAVSNLYWITFSSLGGIALGYFAFGQKLRTSQYIAAALIIIAAVVQLW
jgi:hypothetical protein